jgi:hypothetical protein
VKRDGVRCPCGQVTQDLHSGRRRAPPGSTMRPCQELADDRRVHPKRRRSLLPRRSSSAGMERGWKRCEDRWRDTYGESGACRSAKSSPLARREAPAASGNGDGAIGFCAFRRATPSKPGRVRVAVRRTHAWLTDLEASPVCHGFPGAFDVCFRGRSIVVCARRSRINSRHPWPTK